MQDIVKNVVAAVEPAKELTKDERKQLYKYFSEMFTSWYLDAAMKPEKPKV